MGIALIAFLEWHLEDATLLSRSGAHEADVDFVCIRYVHSV